MIVTTTNDLPGYRIVRHIGVVRGVTVRSRSIIGNIAGALHSLVGGNITVYTTLFRSGEAGDNVGVLLRGTKREEVERGQVLAKPGTITPHTVFTAEAYVLTKEIGRAHV